MIDYLPVDAMLQMINFGVFFLALLYCDQGICLLGAKLFAEESFLLGND